MVETQEYKVPASIYAHSIGYKMLSKWWWIAAMPIVAVLIATMFDWRWIIVLMALLLVLYPGVLMIGFYYYALSPEMAKAILPQRAIFEPEGIRISYCLSEHEMPDLFMPNSNIKCTKIAGKYFEIELPDNFTYKIPITAFSGIEVPKNYNFIEEIVTNCT